MNILLYNWAGIDGNLGGGVNVYVKNLIPGLLNKGNKVTFLNSGVRYTRDNKLKIEKLSNLFNECSRYEIVNSPVLAPAHSMFNNLENVLENEQLTTVFIDFCKDKNFDIIHFNNIEGLSLDILSTKKILKTKFIYTIHNYHVVCPQVNLWKYESENCITCNDFKDCVNCVYPNNIEKEKEKRICLSQNKIIRGIRAFYRRNIRNKILKNNKINFNNDYEEKFISQDIYREYINRSIDAINKNIDLIISVSKRTHDVVCKRGIRENNHKIIYIGTKFAEYLDQYKKYKKYNNEDTNLSIAYLGYMRHDKGYYYLLWMLENLPEFISKHITFIVAARCNNNNEIDRLINLEKKLNSLKYYNGYTHNNLHKILQNVDLGIVPVLWEDCLPQVAIEFVCHGVPVLCSDLGGAHEIGNNKNFIYKSKDKNDFEEKIISFIFNKNRLNLYWDNFKNIKTIEDHVNEIQKIYNYVITKK